MQFSPVHSGAHVRLYRSQPISSQLASFAQNYKRRLDKITISLLVTHTGTLFIGFSYFLKHQSKCPFSLSHLLTVDGAFMFIYIRVTANANRVTCKLFHCSRLYVYTKAMFERQKIKVNNRFRVRVCSNVKEPLPLRCRDPRHSRTMALDSLPYSYT